MGARGRRGGRQGRRKNKEFMDAAVDAYIRHLALEKWRQVTDLQEAAGLDLKQAMHEAGRFAERGVYGDIWRRWWKRQVRAYMVAPSMPLFGHIEAAMQAAVQEERQARRRRGDVTLEDTLPYKAFVDEALDRLFEEEAGSIEEL